MLGFIEFLEELEQNHKTITVPGQDLERLAGKLLRYQDATDPDEVTRLRNRISRELFGD